MLVQTHAGMHGRIRRVAADGDFSHHTHGRAASGSRRPGVTRGPGSQSDRYLDRVEACSSCGGTHAVTIRGIVNWTEDCLRSVRHAESIFQRQNVAAGLESFTRLSVYGLTLVFVFEHVVLSFFLFDRQSDYVQALLNVPNPHKFPFLSQSPFIRDGSLPHARRQFWQMMARLFFIQEDNVVEANIEGFLSPVTLQAETLLKYAPKLLVQVWKFLMLRVFREYSSS